MRKKKKFEEGNGRTFPMKWERFCLLFFLRFEKSPWDLFVTGLYFFWFIFLFLFVRGMEVFIITVKRFNRCLTGNELEKLEFYQRMTGDMRMALTATQKKWNLFDFSVKLSQRFNTKCMENGANHPTINKNHKIVVIHC